MKKRISATIEEETEIILNSLLKGGDYRNKSHIIEKAIELLKEVKSGKNKK
jgi:Arc/MetJ-type ribon-helix-helix transcriptional regulator